MGFRLQAACGCNTGRLRRNNEDNFYFEKQHLPSGNDGTAQVLKQDLRLGRRICFAVFDGMGGENFGEEASHAAAQQMRLNCSAIGLRLRSHEDFLRESIRRMNDAVRQAMKERCTERMGTTVVMASFEKNDVWICNLGDSRAYLLRNGALRQLSADHVEKWPGRYIRKAPLTQYLGIDPEELQLEPHLERFEVKQGDRILLCSDGLTDMLTDPEINAIMQEETASDACVQALIGAALERGGRDNITAIICTINERKKVEENGFE